MNTLKPVVTSLSNARQGIADRKNISENIEKMQNAFESLGPALKGQLEFIQSMSPSAVT